MRTAAAPPSVPSVAARSSSLVWPVGAAYLGAALYVVSPHRDDYLGALVSIVSFALVPFLAYRMRPVRATPICPLNWVLVTFFLQLVVVPLLVCFNGPSPEVLPSLPGKTATNIALLLSTLAYACFGVGYHVMAGRRAATELRPRRAWPPPNRGLLALYIGIGVVGLALSFHGIGSIFKYLGHTVNSQTEVIHHTRAEVLGLFLRAFLGFACVIAWCHWITRARSRPPWKAVAVTGLTVLALVISYGTFSYNRGAFAAPLVALVGVYGLWVRRVSWRWLAVLGIVALVFLTAFRVYRGSHLTPGQATTHPSSIAKKTNVNRELQLYAGGPQFMGYLLEKTDYARHLHYGDMLLGSVMYPVPSLGRPFRANNGVAFFNHLVYGRRKIVDQVMPFQGELFVNFHLPGLVIVYLLLGIAFQRLQRGFERSPTPLQAFAWLYAATWLAYLVPGGLASVSQVFIYFFWPIYALAVWSWLRPQARAPAT